ncbi:MAG: hypothetical protein HYX39_05730 [Bacteroidetes bacterium]|nr:hypothetical protein [Bacteroidota bacterium]
MRKLFIYIAYSLMLSICPAIFFGQSDTLRQIDSLKLKLKNDSAAIYRFKKVRPFLSLDNRHSFIKNMPINVQGLQVGMILHEKHTLGIGFYTIRKESKTPVKVKDQNRVVTQALTMNYFTAFYKYALIDRRYIELDVPLELGLGRFDIIIRDSLNVKELKRVGGGVIMGGAGLNLILKPFKWIGLGLMAGYRTMPNKNLRNNFSGLYYSYGVWIDIRQIYRDVKFYGFKKRGYKRALRDIRHAKSD